MTDSQRALIDKLYEEALALPTLERRAYLNSHCDDPGILREVESLLEYARPPEAISRPIMAPADFAHILDLPLDVNIGPYRVLCAVGEGGMGAVYKAVREDEFRMTVAIKVLRFEARAESDQRRFRQERQILAELQHPNIARLIDGGATAQGLPYIAMEYVEGRPLNAYCTERRLPVADRLRLFRKICDAVQYAHQKLIVHRDIKPGNILVTAEGVPKLLDFGIAKLLAPDTATGPLETVTGLQRMTPDYASPEQVRGEAATVATDVYALGAVLFELLTGERPHRLKHYDMAEILREVCINEVRRPSLVGGPELRGDLDTIVLKAMQKEPGRRYNSVEQLSEDIRRYLDGYPVRARPDTIHYRTRKFVRRNWFSLAAAGAVGITLVGGIVASQYQAQRAEEEFQQARQLAHMALFDVSRELENLPGSRPLRELVVRKGLQYLDRLTPRARRDPGLRYEIADGYYQIGQLQHSHDLSNAGDIKGAIRSWHRALDLIREDAGTDSHPEATKLMSDMLLSTGEAEMLLGHADRAREAFSQAETPAKAQIARHPEAPKSYGSLLSIYNLQGDNEIYAGDPLRALDRYLLTKQISEESVHKTGGTSRYLGSVGIRLGDVYRALGRLPEALDWYRRSLDYVQVEEVARHPGGYNGQLYQAILRGLIGEVYYGPVLTLHDRASALATFQPAYEGMDRLLRTDPNDAQVQDFFILLATGYVYALRETQPREALAVARRVEAVAASLPPGTDSIDGAIDRTAAGLTLARALAANGDSSAAAAAFSEAVRTYNEARAGAPDQPYLGARGMLALLEWGDLEVKRDPARSHANHAEAYRLASEYARAHPAHAYIAALSDLARQRLGDIP